MERRDFPYRVDGNERDQPVAQHLQVVIGTAEQRIVQIDQIAWHLQREDLTKAIAGGLVPHDEALDQHSAKARHFILSDDEFVAAERPNYMRKREYRLPFDSVQWRACDKLVQKAA